MVIPSKPIAASTVFPADWPPELQGLTISYLPPVDGLDVDPDGITSPITSRSCFTGSLTAMNEAWSDIMIPLAKGDDFAAKTFQALRKDGNGWEAAKKTYELLCRPLTGYFTGLISKFSKFEELNRYWDVDNLQHLQNISKDWGARTCVDFFHRARFFNGNPESAAAWEDYYLEPGYPSQSITGDQTLTPELRAGASYLQLAEHFRNRIQTPPFPKPPFGVNFNDHAIVHIPIEINRADRGYLRRWSFCFLRHGMNRGQPLAAFRDSLVANLPLGNPISAPVILDSDGNVSLANVPYDNFPVLSNYVNECSLTPIRNKGFRDLLYYACSNGLLTAIEEMSHWPQRSDIDPLTLAVSINQLCFRNFPDCLETLMKWPEFSRITPEVWALAKNHADHTGHYYPAMAARESFNHSFILYMRVNNAVTAQADEVAGASSQPKRQKPEQAGPSQANEGPHFEPGAIAPVQDPTAAASSAASDPSKKRAYDE